MICAVDNSVLVPERGFARHNPAMTNSAPNDPTSDPLMGLAIKSFRQQMGLSQIDAAAMVNPPVTYQSWQNWERGRGLSYPRLQQVARILKVTVQELQLARDHASDSQVVELPTTHRAMTYDSKVPVYGFAAGAGERIAFNEGQATRFVSIHPNQVGHQYAGAAEVIGESMIPRYRPQEIVYFVRNRHPVRGSDVVVELSDGTAMIKEYDGQRQGQLWLREYCPEERVFGIAADQVIALHAVVGRG